MSSTFVHYSPEIETIDPDINEYMTRIIDFWEKTVRESPVREGTGHAVRGAHAKTLGVVKAEVEILDAAPDPGVPDASPAATAITAAGAQHSTNSRSVFADKYHSPMTREVSEQYGSTGIPPLVQFLCAAVLGSSGRLRAVKVLLEPPG